MSVLQSKNTSTVRSVRLPPGKKFHVLFHYSFNECDQQWVIETANDLEENGFKCCFYDRDFIPGRYEFDLYKTFLSESLNVVVLISSRFLQDDYARHVLHMLLCYSLQCRNKIHFLPILKEGVKLPFELNGIVAIDAEDKKSRWWPRILDSLHNSIKYQEKQPQCIQISNSEVIVDVIDSPQSTIFSTNTLLLDRTHGNKYTGTMAWHPVKIDRHHVYSVTEIIHRYVSMIRLYIMVFKRNPLALGMICSLWYIGYSVTPHDVYKRRQKTVYDEWLFFQHLLTFMFILVFIDLESYDIPKNTSYFTNKMFKYCSFVMIVYNFLLHIIEIICCEDIAWVVEMNLKILVDVVINIVMYHSIWRGIEITRSKKNFFGRRIRLWELHCVYNHIFVTSN